MILAGVAVAHRRLGPSSSATTSTADRALPSSAVQHVLKVVAVADGGCRTGWWPRSPAWTIDSLTVRCGLRSPAQPLMARPGQDGYDIRHALLREVIDADLLPGERARPHAALAHTLANFCSVRVSWTGRTPPPRWPRIGAGRTICQRRRSGRCERPSPARHRRRGRRGDLRAWPPVRDHRRLTHPPAHHVSGPFRRGR